MTRFYAVERDREALAALDCQREQVTAEWRALVAEGDRSAARIVLADVERIDGERGAQAAAGARHLLAHPRRGHPREARRPLPAAGLLFALRHGAVDVR